MRRIVHLTSVHYPFDTRIFHKQLRAVADQGWNATLIAHHPRTEVVDGISIVSAGESNTRPQRWIHLPRFYSIARDQPADVYQIHDPELLPVAVALARQTDATILYDVHEDYAAALTVRDWIPDPLKPLLVRAFPDIQAAAMRYLDGVITADEPTAAAIRTYGIEPATPIHNYPRTDAITIEKPDVEREHEYVLAYVGSLNRERGILRMIELVARLRDHGLDVGLWLLGSFGEDEFERVVHETVSEHHLENAVRFFGWIPYEELFSYLTLADAGLLLVDPDRFERNVPTKLFEYMYAGLPVISTRVRRVERYLPRAQGLFLDSVKDISLDRIREMLETWDSDASERSRRLVEREYSWKREAERLLELYEQVTTDESEK
jgi:glycosyltransferase involved in cell wall biosynthesis